MLLLVNSTKLMDLETPAPPRIRATEPRFAAEAARLTAALSKLSTAGLAQKMELSAALADRARADLVRWDTPDVPRRPAWYAYAGLVYKGLDPRTLDAATRRRAVRRLRILSGLYGVLGPLDAIASHRLEMGSRFKPPGASSMVVFWRERLTAALNTELRQGESVISVASQEYLKAIDLGALRGPVVTPVFKERRADGSLKAVAVHAKTARGSLLRYALETGARGPRGLMGFSAHGWEATDEPPTEGAWLFTRPARD